MHEIEPSPESQDPSYESILNFLTSPTPTTTHTSVAEVVSEPNLTIIELDYEPEYLQRRREREERIKNHLEAGAQLRSIPFEQAPIVNPKKAKFRYLPLEPTLELPPELAEFNFTSQNVLPIMSDVRLASTMLFAHLRSPDGAKIDLDDILFEVIPVDPSKNRYDQTKQILQSLIRNLHGNGLAEIESNPTKTRKVEHTIRITPEGSKALKLAALLMSWQYENPYQLEVKDVFPMTTNQFTESGDYISSRLQLITELLKITDLEFANPAEKFSSETAARSLIKRLRDNRLIIGIPKYLPSINLMPEYKLHPGRTVDANVNNYFRRQLLSQVSLAVVRGRDFNPHDLIHHPGRIGLRWGGDTNAIIFIELERMVIDGVLERTKESKVKLHNIGFVDSRARQTLIKLLNIIKEYETGGDNFEEMSMQAIKMLFEKKSEEKTPIEELISKDAHHTASLFGRMAVKNS